MKAAPLLILAVATAAFGQQQPAPAASQAAAPAQQEQKATNAPATGTPSGRAQQPLPSGSETTEAAKPKLKTGKIEGKKLYKSGRGTFSITVPAAGNPFVRTYEWQAAQLKQDTYDYEEVVFYIADFGQAYGAGVRRIPQPVVAQMAKEEEKQTLSNLANKALFQWRDNYSEEPQPVDELSVQTQFGQGLLRIYLAPRSSLLSRGTGPGQVSNLKLEKFDAYIAVLVVKKDDRFIYATAEDDYLQTGPGAASDPKPDLQKGLQNFFSTLTVAGLSSTVQPPSSSEAAGAATPNSGKPSQQEAPVAFLFSSVAFATPQSGWAVGEMGSILHTEDEGGTWKTQASGTNAFLSSVAFVTPKSGWAVGQGGIILHTENGGGTWKPQRKQAGVGPELKSVAFATPKSGWAVGDGGIILHTEDGGGTWKPQSSGASEHLNSVAFVTMQLGWAVGWKGIILHTEDGGGGWKPQSSGTSEILNSVAFATPQLGWAVGVKGTILHTEDGGVTWTTQSSGTCEALSSVAFATPQSGWAVGRELKGGTILHTENGGATWKAQNIGSPAD